MNVRIRAKLIFRRQKRRGYILLTTLLIIAMVGILTVGLARHSMNLAVSASSSQRELQEKWGAASCQRFAMANQSQLLNRKVWDEEANDWVSQAVPRSESTFVLGEAQFRVRIDDESAKLNLNGVFRDSGRQKTAQLARRFGKSDWLKVDLRPMQNQQRGPVEDAFESWGQVFRGQSNQSGSTHLQNATSRLTCWGSQLNYTTTDEEVLTETCKPMIGAILTQKLIEILDSDEAGSLEEQLLAAGARNEQIQHLKTTLVSHAATQSVWVDSVMGNRRRSWLVVRENVASSMYRLHSFAW